MVNLNLDGWALCYPCPVKKQKAHTILQCQFPVEKGEDSLLAGDRPSTNVVVSSPSNQDKLRIVRGDV